MRHISRLSLWMLVVLTVACRDEEKRVDSIAPFTILNDTTIALNDVIDSGTLDAFNAVIAQNPDTRWLAFQEAPGSEDDETNMQVGRRLNQLRLNTLVEPGGFIASGAVDLFLAGN